MRMSTPGRGLETVAIYCIAVALGCSQTHAEPKTSAKPAGETSHEITTSASSANSKRQDWPCWRGPTSQGIAQGTRLPDPWPAGDLKPLWQTRLGTGWSSPAVVANRVVLTDRQNNIERVVALDADTGQEIWNRSHSVDFDPHPVGRGHGNGPKASPLIEGGKVYSLGIAGWLECLDLKDGHELWHVNLPAEFGSREALPGGRAFVNGDVDVIVPVAKDQGAPVPLFGYTGSPVLSGDLLITSVGGQNGGTVMAFHKETGKVVWKALSENVSYSSPIVATLGGVPQVVVMTGPRVVGLALQSGELLWSHPFQIQHDESISTPVVDGDIVMVTGDSQPLTALRISRRGNALTSEVAWRSEDLSSYLSSMIVKDGHVYGMDDGGQFHCVRISDGLTLWTGGHHGYYCTPVLAAGRIFALNERCELSILAADTSAYRKLGQTRLAPGPSWSGPALVGSRIYIRNAAGASCFELGK
jgi:outer membrane protein assembly factor BamB